MCLKVTLPLPLTAAHRLFASSLGFYVTPMLLFSCVQTFVCVSRDCVNTEFLTLTWGQTRRCAGYFYPLSRHFLPCLAPPVPTSHSETLVWHHCMSVLPWDVPQQALKTATAGNKLLACHRVWDIPMLGGHGDQPPAPLRPHLRSHPFFPGGGFSHLIPRPACSKVKVSPLQPLVCGKAAALVSGKIQNLPFPLEAKGGT